MNTLPAQIRNRIPDPANGYNYTQPRNNYPITATNRIRSIESAFIPTTTEVSGQLFEPETQDSNDDLQTHADFPLLNSYKGSVGFEHFIANRSALQASKYYT